MINIEVFDILKTPLHTISNQNDHIFIGILHKAPISLNALLAYNYLCPF